MSVIIFKLQKKYLLLLEKKNDKTQLIKKEKITTPCNPTVQPYLLVLVTVQSLPGILLSNCIPVSVVLGISYFENWLYFSFHLGML